MKNLFLDGDFQNYDFDRGFIRYLIDDNFGQGVVVKLVSLYIINCIKFLFWDRDMRYFMILYGLMRNICNKIREELYFIK